MDAIKVNEATKVSSLADNEIVQGFDTAGTLKPITVANLRNTILGKITMAAVCDNVKIAYTASSDTDANIRYSKVEDWAS